MSGIGFGRTTSNARDAVGGDEQQAVVAGLVDVADLALRVQLAGLGSRLHLVPDRQLLQPVEHDVEVAQEPRRVEQRVELLGAEQRARPRGSTSSAVAEVSHPRPRPRRPRACTIRRRRRARAPRRPARAARAASTPARRRRRGSRASARGTRQPLEHRRRAREHEVEQRPSSRGRSRARPRSARCRARARARRSRARPAGCPRTTRASPLIRSHSDRVALVRHRARALLSLGERLLHLADLGAREVADLGRDLVERRRRDRERGHVLGVTVALDDLARGLGRPKAEPRADVLLDAGVDLRVGPDGAADLADAHDLARPAQPLPVAVELERPRARACGRSSSARRGRRACARP